MIIEDKILIKNYKCFDSNGVCLDRILPINVIIGKNNSGKSSLIDLVQFCVQNNPEFLSSVRDNKSSEVLITRKLKEKEIALAFRADTGGGGIPGRTHLDYGKTFIDKWYTYRLDGNGGKTFVSSEKSHVPDAATHFYGLTRHIQHPFQNKLYCNITAERDIVPENASPNITIQPNGRGATNYIQQIINSKDKDSRLIEVELLNELNAIVNPDIIFTRILVQQDNNNDKWEIYFEDGNKNRIALSKMGSGIKTILLVLLNLIVKPKMEGAENRDKYVFAFEELENNIHPSLQRRLYDYIRNYSEKFSVYFFLTTHSNIVIDTFGAYEKAQLIHVVNDGTTSVIKTVLSYHENKQILKDLDIRASDLLQSNGIIWVEGPSDRTYLNKWLELLAPELKEGLHYSIMFYGGRLLANLTFDHDWFNKEIVPLLKINTNAFVMIDKDGKTATTKLNDTKIRIGNEVGESNCWVTKGREIENYIDDVVISKWIKEKSGLVGDFKNNKDIKLEDNILNAYGKTNIQYNLRKSDFASEIVTQMDLNSIKGLDLKEKLLQLISTIKEWNSISAQI